MRIHAVFIYMSNNLGIRINSVEAAEETFVSERREIERAPDRNSSDNNCLMHPDLCLTGQSDRVRVAQNTPRAEGSNAARYEQFRLEIEAEARRKLGIDPPEANRRQAPAPAPERGRSTYPEAVPERRTFREPQPQQGRQINGEPALGPRRPAYGDPPPQRELPVPRAPAQGYPGALPAQERLPIGRPRQPFPDEQMPSDRGRPVAPPRAGRDLRPDTGPPVDATTPVARDGSHWRSEHASNVAKAQRGNINTVFYGDSITEAMSVNSNFKGLFGRNAENMGNRGDSTQHLLWRLQHGEGSIAGRQPEHAVMLIGTNNLGHDSEADIVRGIVANVREVSRRMPNTDVVVLGILPRGANPGNPLRGEVARINRAVAAELQGVRNVRFADIGRDMLEPDGRMSGNIWQRDGIHPTLGDGFSRMLQLIKTRVDQR